MGSHLTDTNPLSSLPAQPVVQQTTAGCNLFTGGVQSSGAGGGFTPFGQPPVNTGMYGQYPVATFDSMQYGAQSSVSGPWGMSTWPPQPQGQVPQQQFTAWGQPAPAHVVNPFMVSHLFLSSLQYFSNFIYSFFNHASNICFF